MLNTCFNCGAYRVDKLIVPEGPYAICPECGYRHAFRRLPLLVVSGASGVGKSTVCRALSGKLSEVVLLDSDMLWRREFDKPENKYREYIDLLDTTETSLEETCERVADWIHAKLGQPGNL